MTNSLKIPFVLIAVLFAFGGESEAQIANSYPFDSLIQNDPAVIFTEMFEQSSVQSMLLTPGYQTNTSLSRIHLDATVPAESHGLQSLMLTTVEHSNASNDTMEDANIRIDLPVSISDSVFIRYYIKYNSGHTFHHSGVWAGGTDPSHNCWTCVYPGRYVPVSGDSAFIVGTEVRGAANQSAVSSSEFGFYNYWMGMRPLISAPNTGLYYGNGFNSLGSNDVIDMDAWNCIEMMIKLNNPVSDSTGELKLWINGNLIDHYGHGFPNGTWNEATFVEGAGSPFEGFRWRSNPNVVLNYIWLKNYATRNIPYPTANDLWIDHVVVARNYIGPISTSIATGVNQARTKESLTYYPNPANDRVQLNSKALQVEVFDLYGKRVIELSIVDGFSVAELPDGIYCIRTNEGSAKLMVAH